MLRIKVFIWMVIFTCIAINLPEKAISDFSYVINDFNFYPVPDIPKPEKGVPYIDPIFGTKIVRITDVETEASSSLYLSAGYPKRDIENADGTRLIIYYKYLWNANPPYDKIALLPRNLWDTKDPDINWDAEDPDVLYTTYGTEFVKYDIVTGERTVLRDFMEDFPSWPISRVKTKEEGDASDDRKYWAFLVTCHDVNHDPPWYTGAVIVYDKDYYEKDNGKIVSILYRDDPLFTEEGFSSMSPSGNYVWVGDRHYVYPRDFSSVTYLDLYGHADMAISAEGREVVVGVKSISGKKWMVMVDIETGETTPLVPYGQGSCHISGNCHDKPGWAVFSTYTPNCDELDQLDNWGELSVWMVELTKRTDPAPRIWRIAHTHTCRTGYKDDPFAKINKKGTKIWFGTGWGESNYSDPKGPYDVYQIDLPPTWYEDLKVIDNDPPLPPIGLTIIW